MAAEETLGFIVTFREAFEAFLLAGIITGVLLKTGRRHLLPGVAAGLAAALALGLTGGWLLYKLAQGIPEGELFEASTSLLAAGVVMSVVYWMSRHGAQVASEARSAAGAKKGLLGVALLTLILTGRESLETILMLAPAITSDPLATLAGSTVGAGLAGAIAAAVTLAGVKLNLRLFFKATSLLLVLVAASLAGYGVHEAVEWLEEEGVELGLLAKKVYSLDLPESHPLNPENPVGAVLSVLIGWDNDPEVARLLAQALTLAIGAAIIAPRPSS